MSEKCPTNEKESLKNVQKNVKKKRKLNNIEKNLKNVKKV